MKKPVEESEEFLNLIKEWQALEDRTISSAEELMRNTNKSACKDDDGDDKTRF